MRYIGPNKRGNGSKVAENGQKTSDLSIPNDLGSFLENLFFEPFLPPFRFKPPPPHRAPLYCNVRLKITHFKAF